MAGEQQGPFVDPAEVARQVAAGEIIDGGVVTFELRVKGIGEFGMGVLPEKWARDLLRSSAYIRGVRVNGGPEITR